MSERVYDGSQKGKINMALEKMKDKTKKSGYYICEIEYDMLRVVCWYDEKTGLFKTDDDWVDASEFTYISREPLNLNVINMLPVDVWSHLEDTHE